MIKIEAGGIRDYPGAANQFAVGGADGDGWDFPWGIGATNGEKTYE